LQRVHHTAEIAFPDRHRQHRAGPSYGLVLFDVGEVAKDDHTDLAYVQVECDAARAVLELDQLVRHDRRQPLDGRDAVAARQDGADLLSDGRGRLRGPDEAFEGGPDLLRADREFRHAESSPPE
jgi:hypothetical protein